MVSMMQALQAGTRLTVYSGRITWSTPDGATLGFNNRRADSQLRNVGVFRDLALAQGLDFDQQVELLFVMTEDLLDASKDIMPVASGRRSDPHGRHHGYAVWQHAGTPNHPRIKISPDQVITPWYHWPDGDDQPSAPLLS